MPMAARDIQEIYLAYFGRPADPAGLAHWQAQPSLAQIVNAFAQSAEYQSLYAANDYAQLVTNIYQNLFKRVPETSDLDYWVQQLNEGKVQPGDAALTILDGALGQDAAVLKAKLDAAEAFTATLNTDTLAAAYKGDAPAADARATWATITSAATATAAQAKFPALIDKMQTHWVDGVQKVYVAYFGRPADSAGLNHWVEQAIATNGDWASMAEGFAKSPESQKIYGASSNAALVNAIYLNVLGRAAEPAGSQYWVDQLAKGATTPGALAITLANAAQGKDATTLGQRIDAAKAFTLQLETNGRNDDFTGVAVTAAAREWLHGIGPDQNDYDAAIAAIPYLVNAFVKGQVQGLLVNGYIAGATVFIDADGDGVLDAGEVSVKSDAAGNFLFPEGTATGTVVAFGGTNISTGQPNTATLKAPVGATVVTPLTNLVQQMIDSGLADGIDAAENLLFGALGIPKVDLSAFDPLKTALSGSAAEKAIAIQIEAATVQIANTLATGSALLQGAGLTAAQASTAMLGALTQSIAGGSSVNLGQASTVQTVLQQAVSGSGLTPAQQTQASNAIGATSQVLGEINARTGQAADAFSAGAGTNPISALSDIFKLATLVQTQVTGAVQQGTESGDSSQLSNDYTGDNLTQNVDEVEGGQINPDTPTDDGTEVTNGGGEPPPPPPPPPPIDSTPPTVTSVAAPAGKTYKLGEALGFTVNTSEDVIVTGTPQLALTIGSATVQASYASGSGTSALVFSYTVASTDLDTDGIAVGTLGLNTTGTLKDAAGNALVLALNSVGATTGVKVDSVVPVFTSAATAEAVENQNLLYTAAATDDTDVTYSLKDGDDKALLSIDASTGAVTLTTGELDFDATDAKKTYTFTVVATDAASNASEQAVTVSVTNEVADDAADDETAPLITSGSFTDAPYDGSITQLVFNEAMKVTTLDGVTLVWKDSEGYDTDIAIDISATGTTVNIESELQIVPTDFVKVTFDKTAGSFNIRDLAGNNTDSLIFYIGGSGENNMNANDEHSAVRMEGNGGGDILTGSPYADTIIGGLGADVMTGGEGADIFVFAPGSGSDFIQDWNHAETPDGIAFLGGELAVVTHDTASAGVAAINSYGIATFNAADSTRAGRIIAVEAAINAGGDAAAGQFAVFEYGSSSSFVFISDGTDGVTTNDVLIELVGITGLTTSRINDGVVTLTEPPP